MILINYWSLLSVSIKKSIFSVIVFLLVGYAAFLGWRSLKIWQASDLESLGINFSDISPAKEQKTHRVAKAVKKPLTVKKTMPPRDTFIKVAEKNIFHNLRIEGADESKIPEEKKPQKSKIKAKAKIKPRIMLDGIVMFGNYKAAVIKNTERQRRGRKKVKSSVSVQEGDLIGDRKVIAIKKDHIVVEDEDGEEIIKLYDSNKPKPKPPPPQRSDPSQRRRSAVRPTVPGEMEKMIPQGNVKKNIQVKGKTASGTTDHSQNMRQGQVKNETTSGSTAGSTETTPSSNDSTDHSQHMLRGQNE